MRKFSTLMIAAALAAFAFVAPSQAQFQSQNNVTPYDCSGTITAGGTAQALFAARSNLRGMMIMNIDSTEGLWINWNGTAAANGAGSYFLPPSSTTAAGGSFITPLGFGFNSAPSIVAATTGHKFSCTWW